VLGQRLEPRAPTWRNYALRQETYQRRHLIRTLPRSVLAAASDDRLERAKLWRSTLLDYGRGAIDYPTEYGGRGLDSSYVQAYRAASSGRVPREETTFGISVGMAMPTIRDLDAEELKRRFLRPGLRGEEIWCQLYSEPGSGLDLASLATRAELDRDQWIINGQRVWTSGAGNSQFGILLARTSPDLPKHRCITMLILPMNQPGVEVRPLRQMTGSSGCSGFYEVFMDDAIIRWFVKPLRGSTPARNS